MEKSKEPSEVNFPFSKTLNEIIPNLYLSGQYDAKDKKLLDHFGITHILMAGKGLYTYFPNDYIYRTLQLDDVDNQEIQHLFDEVYEYILY
jgi:hypothetical protein